MQGRRSLVRADSCRREGCLACPHICITAGGGGRTTKVCPIMRWYSKVRSRCSPSWHSHSRSARALCSSGTLSRQSEPLQYVCRWV